MNASLVCADSFPVERGIVFRRDLRIIGRDEEIILLRSHGKGRKQHFFRAFPGIGHIAQEINLAINQHLQKLRPASLHIFIGPARIGGELLLVIVGVAGTPAKLIRSVER